MSPARALALAATLTACAGAAGPSPAGPSPFDEDDPRAAPREPAGPAVTSPAAAIAPAAAAVGPPTAGAGVIARADLRAVLDAGPGRFLAGIEVAPVFRERRFAGWRIERFAPADPRVARAPLAPGDIVSTVNGQPIARPRQLQQVWERLRTAAELVVAGERAGVAFELRYRIVAAQP